MDEVVNAHVESEVAYLEVYPTQVKGLARCHRVGGWMVMCQCMGVWNMRCQCVGVWKVTCQCVGVRNVVWKVRGKYERVPK